MRENQHGKGLMIVIAAACVAAGAVAGFFTAHRMMGDMSRMKPMEMASMPGMGAAAPSSTAAVAIPAVTRQLIGVRSELVAYGTLEQAIRTVGIVDYDERSLTQVNLKVSGWYERASPFSPCTRRTSWPHRMNTSWP